MLSQLSYTPLGIESLRDPNRFDKASNGNLSRLPKVGVPEFESGTSSLSATRSNQLSYTPLSDLRSLQRCGRSADLWSREAAKCTETRLPVKGKKPHVVHRIDDFFDATRDFAVRFHVFDFADFQFWGRPATYWFRGTTSHHKPGKCTFIRVLPVPAIDRPVLAATTPT